MMEELQNDFTKGKDYHPIDIAEAYNLFVNYKMTHYNLAVILVNNSEEVYFSNVGGDEGFRCYKGGGCCGAHGKINMHCYRFVKLGHIAI